MKSPTNDSWLGGPIDRKTGFKPAGTSTAGPSGGERLRFPDRANRYQEPKRRKPEEMAMSESPEFTPNDALRKKYKELARTLAANSATASEWIDALLLAHANGNGEGRASSDQEDENWRATAFQWYEQGREDQMKADCAVIAGLGRGRDYLEQIHTTFKQDRVKRGLEKKPRPDTDYGDWRNHD